MKTTIFILLLNLTFISCFSQIRVVTNGNVGIGSETITPQSLLHIHSLPTSGLSARMLQLTNNQTGTSPSNGFIIRTGSANSKDIEFVNQENLGSLIFNTNSVERLRIATNGCIGIWQNNPTYNLDINGTVRFRTSYVDVLLDNSGMSTSVLYPFTDCQFQLGKDTKRIQTIFANGIHVWNFWNHSDEKYKENFKIISNPLEKIKKINGFTYNIAEKFLAPMPEQERKKYKNQIGFTAQNIKEVFPELVCKKDSSDYYDVNYIGL
ncbi:MAG: tail fiber domain-containing protein, partial [Bacteroidia bacterium]|nr:tail fiber domain-containing protein [Bacteroidia bacterium]